MKVDCCPAVGDTVQVNGMGQPMRIVKIVNGTASCEFTVDGKRFYSDELLMELVKCHGYSAR